MSRKDKGIGNQPCLDKDETLLIERPLPPCCIVIFGATGDLTHRKLMPALFSIDAQGLLPPQLKIVGFARREFSDQSFRDEIKGSLQEFAADLWKEAEACWERFSHRIVFHRSDFDNAKGFHWLKERLDEIDAKQGTQGNRLYYLATPPATYSGLVHMLQDCGLVDGHGSGGDGKPFVRIIVEKPFGSDLDTARALNTELKSVFDESQIYRIDHYLGKETVQNIFVFRFANAIFEPIWNQKYIDNVQITVAETVGVESRAGYFDHAGELRDMVQSHALQLMTLVAMEPPVSLDANAVRDEKVKVLRSLRPITPDEVGIYTVRGQYTDGQIEGKQVPGYLEEPGVAPQSQTETFAALKIEIENWRWAGTPFYIRAGKRMPKRVTEINIQFKNIPAILLAHMANSAVEPNILTIRIQPDEGISMRLGTKPPGQQLRVAPVDLDFAYGSTFGQRIHDAYERLIMDALLGEAGLFTRDDEVEAEWGFITPILRGWSRYALQCPMQQYPAGSWGPVASAELIGEVHPRRRWMDR